MCSRKCFRMPTLVICGVVLTIILVCITGITLTNSINISNIVKLREKAAEALMEGNVDSISLPAAAPLTAATKNPDKNPESTPNSPPNTTNPDITMGIADHNPGGIQFERRAHVKQENN
ncbi:hypothetical protein M5D96_012847 [Drosophila gunungcola]|uniref:Uncharacterized protein n=1 Tax=Drosophila gunungcola TaxID=103775 RepID=A0A9Q0BK49_9MUSC|nr:hypothetical protein M5D96_012847 [Drosophila gunungcola]